MPTNISHQLFDHCELRENTDSKDDFVIKNKFEMLVLMISSIHTKINRVKLYIVKS